MPRILVDSEIFYLSDTQFAKLRMDGDDVVRDVSDPSTYRVYRDPDAFKAVISAARGYNVSAVTEHMHRDIRDFYPDYLTACGFKTCTVDDDTKSIDSADYAMGMDQLRAMMDSAFFSRPSAPPPPPSAELSAKVQELEENGAVENLDDKEFNDISTDPGIVSRISQFVHDNQGEESDPESLGFKSDDDVDNMSDIEKELDTDFEMYKELLRSTPIPSNSGINPDFKHRIFRV